MMKGRHGIVFLLLVGAAAMSCTSERSFDFGAPPKPPGPTFAEPEAGPLPELDAGMCISYDCPAPYVTCAGKPGQCTSNLQTDIANCGACGNACTFGDAGGDDTAALYCVAGKCSIQCKAYYGDCNQRYGDGCEASLLDDPNHCGSCGVACQDGEICWRGACGCPPGYTQCGTDCSPTVRDPLNCGACGIQCAFPDEDAGADAWPCGVGGRPPNFGPSCVSSSCSLGCGNGYADCNQNLCSDGCETNITNDPKNCGECGNACLPQQACVKGRCECEDPSLTYCDQCVNLLTDPLNCGACGRVCPGNVSWGANPIGSPVCRLGRCSYQCPPGRADCDLRIENGCEVETMTDPVNCGGCGVQCDNDAGQPCAAGQCLTKPCEVPDAGVVF